MKILPQFKELIETLKESGYTTTEIVHELSQKHGLFVSEGQIVYALRKSQKPK